MTIGLHCAVINDWLINTSSRDLRPAFAVDQPEQRKVFLIPRFAQSCYGIL